jgi:hypothetical protein
LIIVREPIPRASIRQMAEESFGDMVKAVVDVRREIVAVDAELHADEEAALLEDGSNQADLWGINLYPGTEGEAWIEYDSMINVRPAAGNRSRGVDNAETRRQIAGIIGALIPRE